MHLGVLYKRLTVCVFVCIFMYPNALINRTCLECKPCLSFCEGDATLKYFTYAILNENTRMKKLNNLSQSCFKCDKYCQVFGTLHLRWSVCWEVLIWSRKAIWSLSVCFVQPAYRKLTKIWNNLQAGHWPPNVNVHKDAYHFCLCLKNKVLSS